MIDDRLDVIATDHAPHTWEEKNEPYEKAHAGLPLFSIRCSMMLNYVKQGRITIEKVAEKMSHAVATCFNISERGYIREGYHADLVIVDLDTITTVAKNNILYKCGWSPLEGVSFPASMHPYIRKREHGLCKWGHGMNLIREQDLNLTANSNAWR